ncbi:MAG: ABC transporter permease [Candidatus Omnitrophica bacterium]|nr:ABC transporter permease [Candidatus Omnitrophota bacterium]
MILFYALKELTRRKTRTMLSVLGIFFSITLLVSILAITNAVNKTVSLTFQAAGADMVIQTFIEPGPWEKIRLARHLGPIPINTISQIKSLPEIENATGQLHFWSYDAHKGTMTAVAGINPSNIYIGPLTRQHPLLEKGQGPCCTISQGRPLQPGDQFVAFLDKRFAEILNLKVGSKVRVSDYEFDIIGIGDLRGITRVAQAEIFIPISIAQRIVKEGQKNIGELMAQEGDMVNLILAKIKDTKNIQIVENKIKNLIATVTNVPKKDIKIFTSEKILSDAGGISLLAQTMIKTISLIVILIVMFMVIRTSMASVSERVREIAILKTVGWKDKEIAKLITIETSLQGLIGGILGCITGYFIAFLYIANAKLILPHGMNPFACKPLIPAPINLKVPFEISSSLILLTLIISTGIGVIAGYFAARRAANLKPAQALRKI